ncbi:MAG: HlyD family efflux transporter periplasmic adaptor subunit [Planctomycetota bacterium]
MTAPLPPSPSAAARPRTHIEALAAFDGPPGRFLEGLIALHGRLSAADQGVLLRFDPKLGPAIAAQYNPQRDRLPPTWVRYAADHAQKVFAAPGPVVMSLRGENAEPSWLLLTALPSSPGLEPGPARLMSAVYLSGVDREAVERAAEQIELTLATVSAYDARCQTRQQQAGVDRLTESIDVLAALGNSHHFREAAMVLCNELGARHQAHRVSLGWLHSQTASPRPAARPRPGDPVAVDTADIDHPTDPAPPPDADRPLPAPPSAQTAGGQIRLVAMSRTERLNRRMKLVQDLESAMDECLDQDTEVWAPAPPQVPMVWRDHQALMKQHGSSRAISLPLRRDGLAVGVVLLEWNHEPAAESDRGPAPNASINDTAPDLVPRLRLLAELTTPLLAQLHRRDRWTLLKGKDAVRRAAGVLLGPQHTWAKLAAVGLLAALLWMSLARGIDHLKTTFVIEATERQLVTAPFAGYLESVDVEPGDQVDADASVLATLDTSELRLQAAQLRAEEFALRQQAEQARSDQDMAGVQVALAQAQATAAQRGLLERQIEQARLVSGLTGTVLTGDLKRQLGRAVTEGETLFEVAPLQNLRARLFVPEARAGEVYLGMKGQLATTSYPDQRVDLLVTHIDPVARIEKTGNVFAVEVRLERQPPWLRPGMTGAARLTAGEDRYLILWTRDAVNWLRMKLWL